MNALSKLAPVVSIIDGKPVTTSKNVAEVFEKRHDDVLRAIRKRITEAGEWGVRNFTDTPYIDEQNGQTYSMFTLTKDGFTFLVQKFTGKKAVEFQIAYIEQFNAMETALRNQPPVQKPKSKSKPKELPGGLTLNQQDIMKQMVLTKTKDLPPEKLPGGIIKCWGALKSHFGMTYKAIPPEQFPEAVSLLARLDLEGELIERQKPELELDYSVERWMKDNPWFKPHLQYGPDGKPRMTVQAFMLYGMDTHSAINKLIRELAKAGHNMEACRVELFALRHFMEVYRGVLDDVARMSSRSLDRTLAMGFESKVA